jgi:hypothetical protein
MILFAFSNSTAALILNSGTIQSENVINTPSNLALCRGCPAFMSAPTFEQYKTRHGLVYSVTYAGMTRYFKRNWQALWVYELSRMMYCAHLAVNQNRPS